MKNVQGRTNASVQLGHVQDSWDYSFAAYMGRAKRGDGSYTGYDGVGASGTFDFKNADNLKPQYVNVGLSNENFNFRFIHDDYKLTTSTMYNYIGKSKSFENEFKTLAIVSDYTFHLNSKSKWTPFVKYTEMQPWLQTSESLPLSGFQVYNVKSQRIKYGAFASYDLNEKENVLAGYEHAKDLHVIYDLHGVGNTTFKDGTDFENYRDDAFFSQYLYTSPEFNIDFGLRYETPNYTKDSFLPRIGFTKEEKNWHTKILYSQAFRTPVLQNINNQPKIKPEKTSTAEIEYGHEITTSSYWTANVFNTELRDPIVYFVDAGQDAYDNFGKVITNGAELEFRTKHRWGQAQLGYSFYKVEQNHVSKYKVAQDSDKLVGEPQHKATFNSWFHLGNGNLKINPSLIYYSNAYAYQFNGTAMTLKNMPQYYSLNLFLTRDNLFCKYISGGIGIFNLFNHELHYIQPYGGLQPDGSPGGEHGPVPGPSREFVAKLNYKYDY
jgi:hypothetical protein